VFSIRKNFIAGLAPAFLVGVFTIFVPIIRDIAAPYEYLLRELTPLGDFPGWIRQLVAIAMLLATVYGIGLASRAIGLYAGRDVDRAKRLMRRVERMHLGMLWRFTVGFAILADALQGLMYVRVTEFAMQINNRPVAKRTFGVITKVQRVHRRAERTWRWEFIVYKGDFPTYILGRIDWYDTDLCEKVLTPIEKMFVTLMTVGFAAPNRLQVDRFTETDFAEIEARLKERESLLIAAGLTDPDESITTHTQD
jgi:hypothetical protein